MCDTVVATAEATADGVTLFGKNSDREPNEAQSVCFIIEMVFGLIVPFVLLLSARVRNTPRLLFFAALLIVLGVAFNRINVFLVAYQPPYATKTYFPTLWEIAVTVGLVSLLMLIYRVIVTYLPVISHPDKARMA